MSKLKKKPSDFVILFSDKTSGEMVSLRTVFYLAEAFGCANDDVMYMSKKTACECANPYGSGLEEPEVPLVKLEEVIG